MTHRVSHFAALICCTVATQSLASESGPGYSQTEIKLGNLMPYSGPASSYGSIGLTEAAYFEMINDRGGINGRKVKFISYDDGFSPPKAVEQARRLVEGDEVLAIFQSIGNQSNAAIQRYMNAKKVPQLFVGSGASKFSEPQRFPWTLGLNPTYEAEVAAYGKYIAENKPNGKIAIIYQNDDSSRDSIKGLEGALGAKASNMIISRVSYEVTDPVVDSQVVAAKASGADVLVSLGTPRAGSQIIRKAAELNWKPLFFIAYAQSSVANVLEPAGLENAKGLISSSFMKDPTDPSWKDDPEVVQFRDFMSRYNPNVSWTNWNAAYGYLAAQIMVHVLEECGDDLSRENVMKQATNLKNFTPALLLPGAALNTTPESPLPLRQLQLVRFDGTRWQLFGKLISE